MNAAGVAKSTAQFFGSIVTRVVKSAARDIAEDFVAEVIDKESIKESVQNSRPWKKSVEVVEKARAKINSLMGKKDKPQEEEGKE